MEGVPIAFLLPGLAVCHGGSALDRIDCDGRLLARSTPYVPQKVL